MKKVTLLAGAVSLALFSCGNTEPVTYQVALSLAGLSAPPGSCYTSGVAPTTTETTTNLDQKGTWTLWNGTNLEYLDVGDVAFAKFGDSTIDFSGKAIEGGPTAFTESNVETDSSTTTKTTTSITVTFSGTPGNTATGTVEYKLSTSCTGCTLACDMTANFVARKVDVQPTTKY